MKDKAQTEAIGFIFFMAILISLASVLVVTQIPVQEQNSEINHERTVEKQFSDMSSSILQSGLKGEKYKLPFKLGVDYPSGFVFITPVPVITSIEPSGELFSDNLGEIQLAGFEPVPKSNKGETWNTTFETSFIRYDIEYNHQEPTPERIYENTAYYYRYDVSGETRYIVKNEPNIISGNTINIPIVKSDLRTRSTADVSVEIQPISSSENNDFSIKVKDGETGEIKIPTKLPLPYWNQSLSTEPVVKGLSASNDKMKEERPNDPSTYTLTIELKEGIYNINTPAVRVSDSTVQTIQNSPTAQYVTLEKRRFGVKEDDNISVTAVPRDKYNNPVPNQKVYINKDSSDTDMGNFMFPSSGGLGSGTGVSVTSDSNGKATAIFKAQKDGEVTFTAERP